MEGILAVMIGALVVATAPLVPVVRPVAKAAVLGGLTIAETAVAVATVAGQQLEHLRTRTKMDGCIEPDSTPASATVQEDVASSADAAIVTATEDSGSVTEDYATDTKEDVAAAEGAASVVENAVAIAEETASAAYEDIATDEKEVVAVERVLVGVAEHTAQVAEDAIVAAEDIAGVADDTASVAEDIVTASRNAATTAEKSDDSAFADIQPDGLVTAQVGEDAGVVVDELAGETDDLTAIKGIGPKVADVLMAAGVTTYARLATMSVEQLRELLAAAGPRYRGMDPTLWPEQAHWLLQPG